MFDYHYANYCGKLTLFADCKVCGETYWAGNGYAQANRWRLRRCMANHHEQDNAATQITRTIAYHESRV